MMNVDRFAARWCFVIAVLCGCLVGCSPSSSSDSSKAARPRRIRSNPLFAGDDPVDTPKVLSGGRLSTREVVEAMDDAVAFILVFDALDKQVASGSGFFIDDQGTLATNLHVIEDGVSVTVHLRDGTGLDVSGYVAIDRDHDLALLKIEDPPETVDHVELQPANQLAQGEDVIAIGHPSGFTFTVTTGIVSAVRTTAQLPDEYQLFLESPDETLWVQTNAAISGGNSGGPLLDSFGHVIGINTWVANGQNLGFAIHVKHLLDLVEAAGHSDTGDAVTQFPVPGAFVIGNREVATVMATYEAEVDVFHKRMVIALNSGEMDVDYFEDHPMVDYAQRLVALAEKDPASDTAFAAATTICQIASETGGPVGVKVMDEAADILAEHHWSSPRLLPYVASLRRGGDESRRFLKELMEKPTSREVQGIAMFALASNLMRQDAGLNRYRRDAIRLFEVARATFGDVNIPFEYGRTASIEELCDSALFTVEHRQIGSQAAEIEGETVLGDTMRLSDYRGKVVVLDFWADWCVYCREMYPDERKLVERYADQPFALLGVNCDVPGRARQLRREGVVTWSSWYDGQDGPIGRDWQIESYPTVYVLDAEGRIRFSNLQGEDLEAAVEYLMNEHRIAEPDNLIGLGAEWSYWSGEGAPGADWISGDTAESSWTSGPAPIGYGAEDVLTELEPGSNSLALRKTFQVEDLDAIQDLALALFCDDGAAVYINGTEVARCYLAPDAGFSDLAYDDMPNNGMDGRYILVDKKVLVPGENVIAVEVHQGPSGVADLMFDLALGTNYVEQLGEWLGEEELEYRVIDRAGELRAEALLPRILELQHGKTPEIRFAAVNAAMAIDPDSSPQWNLRSDYQPAGEWDMSEFTSRTNTAAWVILKSRDRSDDDFRQGLRLANASRALDFTETDATFAVALGSYRLEYYDAAVQHLRNIGSLRDNNLSELALLAMSHHQLGQSEKATGALEQAEELAEESGEVLTDFEIAILEEARALLSEASVAESAL